MEPGEDLDPGFGSRSREVLEDGPDLGIHPRLARPGPGRAWDLARQSWDPAASSLRKGRLPGLEEVPRQGFEPRPGPGVPHRPPELPEHELLPIPDAGNKPVGPGELQDLEDVVGFEAVVDGLEERRVGAQLPCSACL